MMDHCDYLDDSRIPAHNEETLPALHVETVPLSSSLSSSTAAAAAADAGSRSSGLEYHDDMNTPLLFEVSKHLSCLFVLAANPVFGIYS